MPAVPQKQMLNNAVAEILALRKEVRWLKKQVNDLLDVAENIHYASQRGDWNILDAAGRGAVRLLKRHKRFNTEDAE
jgi:hypothetical protein